jgi:hypothetical protein
MYDLGNTELIEKSDVSKMLDSVLSENPTMYIPEEDLAYIMNQVCALLPHALTRRLGEGVHVRLKGRGARAGDGFQN